MITAMRNVEAIIQTRASAREVTNAFLEEAHLRKWWGVQNCLIDPKVGGVWTLAWEITPMGIRYISSGFIHDYEPGEYLRIDNLVYLNPERQILGPQTLEIFADEIRNGTRIRIIQSGYQEGEDWDWYYEAVKQAWPMALETLRKYLESIN